MAAGGPELDAAPETLDLPGGGICRDIVPVARGVNGRVWLARVEKAPEGGRIKAGDVCAIKVSANLTPENIMNLERERDLLAKEGSLIDQFVKDNKMISVIQIAPGIDLRDAIYNTKGLDGQILKDPSGEKEVKTKKKLKDPPGITLEDQHIIRMDYVKNKGLDNDQIIILNKIMRAAQVPIGQEIPAEYKVNLLDVLKLLKNITMDDILFIQGKITREDKLSPEEKKNIALGLLRNQYALQQLRLVHCDQKPDNIQLHPESGTPKIIDLGNAIDLDKLYRHPQFQSAGDYVGPEVDRMYSLDRVNSIQSDECSLGMVIASLYSSRSFEQDMGMAATGVMPKPREIMADVLGTNVRAVPDMDPNLLEVVQHLTAANPSARPDSIGTARGILRIPEMADLKEVRMSFARELTTLKGELSSIIADLPAEERDRYDKSVKQYKEFQFFSENVPLLLDDLENLSNQNRSITEEIARLGRRSQTLEAKKPLSKEEKKEKDDLRKKLTDLGMEQTRIKQEFDGKLDTFSKSPQIPEKVRTLLTDVKGREASFRSKLDILFEQTKVILKENPQPPLEVITNAKDLNTVYDKINQYKLAHPENKLLNEKLNNVLIRIDGECKKNANDLQQNRLIRMEQYTSAVRTVADNLTNIADQIADRNPAIQHIIMLEVDNLKKGSKQDYYPYVRSKTLESKLNSLKEKLKGSPDVVNEIDKVQRNFDEARKRAQSSPEIARRASPPLSAAVAAAPPDLSALRPPAAAAASPDVSAVSPPAAAAAASPDVSALSPPAAVNPVIEPSPPPPQLSSGDAHDEDLHAAISAAYQADLTEADEADNIDISAAAAAAPPVAAAAASPPPAAAANSEVLPANKGPSPSSKALPLAAMHDFSLKVEGKRGAQGTPRRLSDASVTRERTRDDPRRKLPAGTLLSKDLDSVKKQESPLSRRMSVNYGNSVLQPRTKSPPPAPPSASARSSASASPLASAASPPLPPSASAASPMPPPPSAGGAPPPPVLNAFPAAAKAAAPISKARVDSQALEAPNPAAPKQKGP